MGFALTVNDFRIFLSQFSTNCLKILQALFSSYAATDVTMQIAWETSA